MLSKNNTILSSFFAHNWCTHTEASPSRPYSKVENFIHSLCDHSVVSCFIEFSFLYYLVGSKASLISLIVTKWPNAIWIFTRTKVFALIQIKKTSNRNLCHFVAGANAHKDVNEMKRTGSGRSADIRYLQWVHIAFFIFAVAISSCCVRSTHFYFYCSLITYQMCNGNQVRFYFN